MAEHLNLSAEQQKKMDVLFDDSRTGLLASFRGVQQAEARLEPMMAAEQPVESAILAQIDKVAEARAALEKTRARMLLSIRAQLTSSQWATLRQMRPPAGPQRPGPCGPGPGRDDGEGPPMHGDPGGGPGDRQPHL